MAGERDRVEARSARVTAMTGIDRQREAVDADAPEFPPALDLVAPIIGLVGLVAAGMAAGDPAALSVARVVVGRGVPRVGHRRHAPRALVPGAAGHAPGPAARAGAVGGDHLAVRGGRDAVAGRHGRR